MAEKTFCPVCRKVVGAWHKSGVHPHCAPKIPPAPKPPRLEDAIATKTVPLTPPPAQFVRPVSIYSPGAQARRDAVLRKINSEPRPRR